MSLSEQTDLVLGTAGHIDHGKSSLVLALTGTDPDRLAEEKQRGITIELGFARLALPDGTTLGVVDVPGHERFVRQMIAGSTGIDLALLCIAADDGVMPQTLEHLAVLELLGIRTCVIALTKTDLVDEEWALFVAEEIRGRLANTPYANAEIVPVSSRTKAGLPELQEALARAAHATRRAKAGSRLRLPVDRVFSVRGAGTVVTGTLWSGTAQAGDEVEVLPSGLRTRVRGVQVHGAPVERAEAGHRVALNLNAVSTDDVRPGDFLSAPGTASATDHFDAYLTYLGIPGKNKPLTSGSRVHVAHGTREVTGRMLLMNGQPSLATGERAYAQIRLDEPLPVAWRDRFIIRSYSPVHVIGGGEVLRAHPRRTTTLAPGALELLEALRSEDPVAIARAAFSLANVPVTSAELAVSSGLEEPVAQRELEALASADNSVVRLGDNGRAIRYAAAPVLQKMRSALENALLKFHAQNPSATGIAKEALRQRSLPRLDGDCFDALLDDAVSRGAAVSSGGEVSHPKAGAGARKLEEQAAEQLHAALAAAGATPPSISDLIAASSLDTSLVYRALGSLEKQGLIRRVGSDFCFDERAFAAFERAARERLANGSATAAELKDAMRTSRKYAIPLLEYFDAQGITRRDGDMRTLGER